MTSDYIKVQEIIDQAQDQHDRELQLIAKGYGGYGDKIRGHKSLKPIHEYNVLGLIEALIAIDPLVEKWEPTADDFIGSLYGSWEHRREVGRLLDWITPSQAKAVKNVALDYIERK